VKLPCRKKKETAILHTNRKKSNETSMRKLFDDTDSLLVPRKDVMRLHSMRIFTDSHLLFGTRQEVMSCLSLPCAISLSLTNYWLKEEI